MKLTEEVLSGAFISDSISDPWKKLVDWKGMDGENKARRERRVHYRVGGKIAKIANQL